jgi:hypothetical protein
VSAALSHRHPPTRLHTYVNAQNQALRYTARLALDERTRCDAFSLRYNSYVSSGFIDPNRARSFSDKYDDLPNASTIVIYSQDRAVGSIRTCFLSRDGGTNSPARETFPQQVDELLQRGPASRRGFEGVELTRMVRSPEAENNQGLIFLLFRLAGHLALVNDFQVSLSCVRQNHVSFYRRLKFVELTPLAPYPGLRCPMQMLACRRADSDAVRATYPIMDCEAGLPGALDGLLTGEVISLSLRQHTRETDEQRL